MSASTEVMVRDPADPRAMFDAARAAARSTRSAAAPASPKRPERPASLRS